MKYSDIPDGAIFYIEGSYTYPKKKVGLGHLDIRDNVRCSHGSPDWNVELSSDVKDELQPFVVWGKLADIPINEDEIEIPFLHFDAGTDRFEIWHWIEEKFDISISTLRSVPASMLKQ